MEKQNRERERKRIADPTGRDRDRRYRGTQIYLILPTFCFSSSSLLLQTAKNKKIKAAGTLHVQTGRRTIINGRGQTGRK
jgi:hypothetical protein